MLLWALKQLQSLGVLSYRAQHKWIFSLSWISGEISSSSMFEDISLSFTKREGALNFPFQFDKTLDDWKYLPACKPGDARCPKPLVLSLSDVCSILTIANFFYLSGNNFLWNRRYSVPAAETLLKLLLHWQPHSQVYHSFLRLLFLWMLRRWTILI